MNKNISSPFSTGGGGGNFERYVGAYYLASLLIQNIPRGLNTGTANEVRFQRLFEGESLDDLIVITKSRAGKSKLALQIKRDISFGEKDEVFSEVIEACWQTFCSKTFERGRDRLGICLGLYSKYVDEHYQTVLSWARNSVTAEDFFKRNSVKKLASEVQRSFVTLIRNKVDSFLDQKVTDEDLWSFLKCFVILRFDLHTEGSADYAHCLGLLRYVVQDQDNKTAGSLFDKLSNKYTANLNQTAGSIDANTLRRRLVDEDGLALNTPADFQDDIDRLNQHSMLILNNIRTDIDGFELNRINEIETASKMLEESNYVEITGQPGSGKSSLLKSLAQNQIAQGGTIILAGERIEGTGWNSFARSLGLSNRLQDILLSISNSPEPTVFIDNPDRLLDAGSRQVIKDLLYYLLQENEQSGLKRWKIVVSIREENLNEFHTWFDWKKLGSFKLFQIPGLSDSEIQLISETFPRIKPLAEVEKLKPILQNPLMLNLLVDKRVLPSEEAKLPPIATELEVQNVWWNRIVGSNTNDGGGGTVVGRNRQLELLRVGNLAIGTPGKSLILNESPANVLLSLENDRILSRDKEREVHRFGHDLFEDWVLLRVLNQHRDSITVYLQNIGQPHGLLRPMQLLGCSILESEEPIDNWRLIVERVENAELLSPRWRQALYSSPLISTRAFELLNKLAPALIENEGKLLRELLIVLRTSEINPDLSLLPFLSKSDFTQGNLPSVLFTMPVPRWKIWLPFIKWLVLHSVEIPDSVRDEVAKVFEIWQKQTPKGAVFRREIGEISFSWLEEIERWYD